MRSSLALITAPTIEPVTLAELKAWARIDGDDENFLLSNLITAARQEAEKFMRSAIVTQTWELTIDLGCSDIDLGDGVYDLPITILNGDLPQSIDLPYAPIQSITSAKYYDLDNTLTTFDAANYSLDTTGARFVLDYNATYPTNMRQKASFVIRYVAGYSTTSQVPYAIKMAIMSYAQACYELRGVCDNDNNPLKELQTKLQSFKRYG